MQRRVLVRGIIFNTLVLAMIMGMVSGWGLFCLTHLSLLITGDHAGHYLNLLGVIFPGYSASITGAWFGLLWGGVFGAFSGAFVYGVYVFVIGTGLVKQILSQRGGWSVTRSPVMLISGHPLGIALGLLMALQLYGVTTWLILRGTADQSLHAALLVHYFPGYSVTYLGGLYGALQMFGFTYLTSLIFTTVYNGLVAIRKKAIS